MFNFFKSKKEESSSNFFDDIEKELLNKNYIKSFLVKRYWIEYFDQRYNKKMNWLEFEKVDSEDLRWFIEKIIKNNKDDEELKNLISTFFFIKDPWKISYILDQIFENENKNKQFERFKKVFINFLIFDFWDFCKIVNEELISKKINSQNLDSLCDNLKPIEHFLTFSGKLLDLINKDFSIINDKRFFILKLRYDILILHDIFKEVYQFENLNWRINNFFKKSDILYILISFVKFIKKFEILEDKSWENLFYDEKSEVKKLFNKMKKEQIEVFHYLSKTSHSFFVSLMDYFEWYNLNRNNFLTQELNHLKKWEWISGSDFYLIVSMLNWLFSSYIEDEYWKEVSVIDNIENLRLEQKEFISNFLFIFHEMFLSLNQDIKFDKLMREFFIDLCKYKFNKKIKNENKFYEDNSEISYIEHDMKECIISENEFFNKMMFELEDVTMIDNLFD